MFIFCLTLDWNEQAILTAHNQWQCDEAFLIHPEDSMMMAAIINIIINISLSLTSRKHKV